MSFLRLDAVAKRFGSVKALQGIDLATEAGSRTAVVGPSGSGKSTLLRIVAGFEAPDAGRVFLDGQCLADGTRIVPAHLRSIGLVAQDGALFPHLDVAGNIGFGLAARAPNRRERILALMDMVDLDRSMRVRRPHELSGGQQQRVALARALARRPKLMLLDEPFSALDTGLRETMRRTVADVLAREGIAAVLVTHDQTEALSFADQVVVLRDGRLAQAGAPRALYVEPRDPATASFLGDAIIVPAVLDAGYADCALGRVRTHRSGRRGPARIMVRPEQLRLARSGVDASAGNGSATCRGRVVDVEFGGPTCSVRLLLLGAEAGASFVQADLRWEATTIQIKVPSIEPPRIGEIVAIAVDGFAVVFDL